MKNNKVGDVLLCSNFKVIGKFLNSREQSLLYEGGYDDKYHKLEPSREAS